MVHLSQLMHQYPCIIILQSPYFIQTAFVLPNILILRQDPVQDTVLHLVTMSLWLFMTDSFSGISYFYGFDSFEETSKVFCRGPHSCNLPDVFPHE